MGRAMASPFSFAGQCFLMVKRSVLMLRAREVSLGCDSLCVGSCTPREEAPAAWEAIENSGFVLTNSLCIQQKSIGLRQHATRLFTPRPTHMTTHCTTNNTTHSHSVSGVHHHSSSTQGPSVLFFNFQKAIQSLLPGEPAARHLPLLGYPC